jgi:predicted HTH transcriptional regulator
MKNETKEAKELREKTEQYFAAAFCGKKATIRHDIDNFKIFGVVEIETGDQRGTIYVALANKI